MLYSQLSTGGLRISGMIFRFAALVLCAKKLDLAENGQLLLIIATIEFFVYLVGLDFYTYANRELARCTDDNDRWHIFIKQGLFYFFQIIILLPIAILTLSNIQQEYLKIFIFLFLAELALIEAYRILVMIGQPVKGSIALFLKQAGWPLILIAGVQFDLEISSVITILKIWIFISIFNLISLFIFFRYSFKSRSYVINAAEFIEWVLRGMKFAVPLYISAICTKGVSYFDKYFISQGDPIELGYYGFYFSVASMLLSLVDSMVTAHYLPRILAFDIHNDSSRFDRLKLKALRDISIICLSAILAIYIFMPFVIQFIDKPEYASHTNILYILILSMAIKSIGSVNYMELYSRGATIQIMSSHILFLMSFFIAIYLLGDKGALSVSYAMLFSTVLLVILYYIFSKIVRHAK